MSVFHFREITVIKDFRKKRQFGEMYFVKTFEVRYIFVDEDFEVKKGLLGLDRDNYLNIIQFLDSLTVRKVCLSVFVVFSLLFFL
jgi:hypothetical protein